MLFGRVAMHIEIFPAIAKVGFIAVKYHQPALINQTETLGRFPIVLVNFREPVGEFEFLVVNRVVEGQFHQFQFREHLFECRPNVGVETIIVIDMQESTALQIFSKVFGFLIGECPTAVTRHVDERVIEQLGAPYFYAALNEVKGSMELLIAECSQVF